MKKLLMSAAAVMCIASPAMANEDSAMHKNEKVEMKAKHYFAEMDANKDGSVSKAEHDSFGDQMFTDADGNKDGSVSMDELKSAKKKEMDKMDAMKPEHGNN